MLAKQEDESVEVEQVDEALEDAFQDERDKRRVELDYHVGVLRLSTLCGGLSRHHRPTGSVFHGVGRRRSRARLRGVPGL